MKFLTNDLTPLGITILLISTNFAGAQSISVVTSVLTKSFDLAGKHAASSQFFVMESKLTMFAAEQD